MSPMLRHRTKSARMAFAIMLVGAAASALWAQAAPPDAPPASISGRVVDLATGAPIAGAVVNVQPLTGQPITQTNPAPPLIVTRTDSDGRFTVSGWRTPAVSIRS